MDERDLEQLKEENGYEYDLQMTAAELMGILFKTHKESVDGLVQCLRSQIIPDCFSSQ